MDSTRLVRSTTDKMHFVWKSWRLSALASMPKGMWAVQEAHSEYMAPTDYRTDGGAFGVGLERNPRARDDA